MPPAAAPQRSTATPPTWRRLVSFAVSFSYVRTRPARTAYNGQPKSRTLLSYAEPSPTDLESVLGATPREFESRILRYGLPRTGGVRSGAGLAARALRSAAALAAALARLAFCTAACSASSGVIQESIGPRAARHTLPWWPPGTVTNGTSATLVSSSARNCSAATTSPRALAPAASQKAGTMSLTGTLVTYAMGVLRSRSAGCPANTLTDTGLPPGLFPAGT